MSSFSRFAIGTSALLIAQLLTGCGQTGPLYLPQVPPPVTAPGDTGTPAASQEPSPTSTPTQ